MRANPRLLTVRGLTGGRPCAISNVKLLDVSERATSAAPMSEAVVDSRFSTSAAISKEMVRLYKAQFGRGPTGVRTVFAGPDTVLVTLEDTLTPAERNLVAMGEHHRLRDTRMFFQYASVKEFCEPVERLTGRKVRSFLSSIDTHVDGLAMEAFVLYPVGYSGPSRTDASDARRVRE